MPGLEQQMKGIRDALTRIAHAEKDAKDVMLRRAYYENRDAVRALAIAMNPSIDLNVGPMKLKGAFEWTRKEAAPFTDLFEMCDWLIEKEKRTEQDVSRIVWSISNIISPEIRSFTLAFLRGRASIGMNIREVNRALGFVLVPEAKYMRPRYYFSNIDLVEGKYFYLTEKKKGVRCVAIVRKDGVTLIDQDNKPFEGFPDIKKALRWALRTSIKDMMFDGVVDGSVFWVFDCMDADEYEALRCPTLYYGRRKTLERLIPPEDPSVCVLPVLYQGMNTQRIYELVNTVSDGLMVNPGEETYQFGRSCALLRAPPMGECLVPVSESSRNRNSLVVDYRGTLIPVTLGVTKEILWELHHYPEWYVGHTARIRYAEETVAKDGGKTIRYPVFMGMQT